MCLDVINVIECIMNNVITEIKTCYRCDSLNTLEYVENYELTNHDTDELEKHNGYLCNVCNCFHAEDSSFVEYPINKEWRTNYNVRSWLN